MRVVSLLPSATETLCLLGGSDLLVGRSHECDFPGEVSPLPVLTEQRTAYTTAADVDRQVTKALASSESLYRLDTERLRQLKPDVILTQDLCEVCSIDLNTVRRAASELDPSPEVVSLNPESVEEVFDDVLRVGRAVGREADAEAALVALRERFFAAADHVNPYEEGPSVLFLEWTDPLYVGGHWTPQLIERAGGRHPLNPTRAMPGAGAGAGGHMAHRKAGKSVKAPAEVVAATRPDAVVVCPCGLTLEQGLAEVERLADEGWWAGLPAVRSGRVAVVDGSQMFNRPGPRLVDAFEWLVGWLSGLPELIPERFPWAEPLA